MGEFFSSLVPLQAYALSIFFLANYLDGKNKGVVATINFRNEKHHWAIQMLYMVVGMTAILYLMATLVTAGGSSGADSGSSPGGTATGSSGLMPTLIFAPLSAFYIFGFVRHVGENIAGKKSLLALWIAPSFVSIALTAWWVFFPSWASLNIAATVMMLYVLSVARLANLYTAVMILAAFALYDVLNVFGTGLMMKAAMPSIGKAPLLVVVPSSPSLSAHRTSALGLGDIVLPGLAILAAFREARAKKNPLFSVFAIAAYVIALAGAFVAVRLTESPQPALLYISPALIIALLLADPIWNAWKRMRKSPQN